MLGGWFTAFDCTSNFPDSVPAILSVIGLQCKRDSWVFYVVEWKLRTSVVDLLLVVQTSFSLPMILVNCSQGRSGCCSSGTIECPQDYNSHWPQTWRFGGSVIQTLEGPQVIKGWYRSVVLYVILRLRALNCDEVGKQWSNFTKRTKLKSTWTSYCNISIYKCKHGDGERIWLRFMSNRTSSQLNYFMPCPLYEPNCSLWFSKLC